MKSWKKRFCALLAALCLLPSLPAAAAEALSLEWRQAGSRQAELVLRGVEEGISAVQLELTLAGDYRDLEFTPDRNDLYSPDCRVRTENGQTRVTVYLLSDQLLNPGGGESLYLGTLETSNALPCPEEAVLTLLDRDLQPLRGANGNAVSLRDRDDGGSESESGASSRGYRIRLEDADHGTLRSSPQRAEEGDAVTLTVRPDTGYLLDRLSVRDEDGRALSVKELGENRYRFTMPDGPVTAEARFVRGEQEIPVLPFTDVTPGDWFYEAAGYVYSRGLMLGTTTSTFSPDVTTNRGMIVTILHRLEGEPAAETQDAFRDVPREMYCAAAVDWAAANGIVNGYEDGSFKPRNTITREQLAAILHRYAAYKHYDTAATGSLGDFSDGLGTSPFAQDAVRWALGNGLLREHAAGLLSPRGGATRAQAAYALTGLCRDIAALS